jgi:hypothetical protein
MSGRTGVTSGRELLLLGENEWSTWQLDGDNWALLERVDHTATRWRDLSQFLKMQSENQHVAWWLVQG